MMKSLLRWTLLAAGLILSCASPASDAPVRVKSVTLTPASLALMAGTSAALKAQVTPAGALGADLTWTSDDPQVAAVDPEGLVTALVPGTTVVRVHTAAGPGAEALVTVTPEPVRVTGISLVPGSLDLSWGASAALTAEVTPAGATDRSVTWSSTDAQVATVDGTGLVTAVGSGTCEVRALTADGGFQAACAVRVTPPVAVYHDLAAFQLVEGVPSARAAQDPGRVEVRVAVTNLAPGLEGQTLGLAGAGLRDTSGADFTWNNRPASADLTSKVAGGQAAFTWYFDPTAASTDLKVFLWGTWTEVLSDGQNSDHGRNLQIPSADLTALAAGGQVLSLTLDASSASNGSPFVPVTGVGLSPSSVTVMAGSTVSLTAALTPANPTLPGLAWSSDDPAVATVNAGGLVTALAKGTTVVRVTTVDGALTAQTSVTVTPSTIPVAAFYLDLGANDGTKGAATASPDSQGHSWNNLTNPAVGSLTALVDGSGAALGASVEVTKAFLVNGLAGGGGLLAPRADLLGDLAVAAATQDYFFVNKGTTGSLKFTGLSATRTYRFTVFGSRAQTETRVASYTFTGATVEAGSLQTSGTDLGGPGVNCNTSTVLVTGPLAPAADGSITFDLTTVSGTYGHVNLIKAEVFVP